MATKRMTAQDYRKELADIKQQKKALEARIVARAKELCKQNPDIWLTLSGGNINAYKTSDFINESKLHVQTALGLIKLIEKELADKHPHKQTTIKGFN